MAKPSLFTPEMIEKNTRAGYWDKTTLSDYWDKNAKDYPDKVALADSKTSLTWRQANRLINRLALSLLELGLKRDQVVVMQLPPCIELVLLHVACEKAGLLHLQVTHNLRQNEMAHIFKHTKAKAIVIPWEYRNFDFYEMVRELKSDSPFLEHIIIWGDDIPDGTLALKEFLRIPLEEKYPKEYLAKKKMPGLEVSLLGQTTGTTGIPKIVELPMCSVLLQAKILAPKMKMTGD